MSSSWCGQAKPATPGHSKNATFETVSLHFQSLFFFVYLPKIGDVNATLKKCDILKLHFQGLFLLCSPKIRRRWLQSKVNCYVYLLARIASMLRWNETLLGLIFINLEIAQLRSLIWVKKYFLNFARLNNSITRYQR